MPDPLFELIAGEFALQEGNTEEAAQRYVSAAAQIADPVLAERAARLALAAGQVELTRQSLQHWKSIDPKANGQQRLELSLALETGDAAAAQQALTRVLQEAQGWRSALQVLAGHQTSLVARTLLASLTTDPAVLADLDALLAVGGLAERMELDGTVSEVADRVTANFVESPRAWLWRAEVARKRDDFASARVAVAQALALPTLGAELRMAAAGMLSAMGDPAAAAQALADGEQTAATRAGRAAFLARADDNVGLAALYQELLALPAPVDDDRAFLLGQLAEMLEQLDQALDWYRQVGAGEQAGQARLRTAVVHEQRGDLQAALLELEQIQNSDSDDGRLLIDAYLLEGELLIKHARFDEAIEVYGQGLAQFEDDGALLYARALLHERIDRLDAAEGDFRRMLEIEPDSPDVLNALGYTLADRTDRFDEAYALIRRALNMQPDNAAIIDSMGWVLFRMGRHEEALPHLRRAFELQRDAEVAAHLGEVLWALGKQDEARSVWRLGFEIDPENRAILRVQPRLESAS